MTLWENIIVFGFLIAIFLINNKGGILMEGIVWIIALIGGVYVFGMSTSPSGEIEKISDEKIYMV